MTESARQRPLRVDARRNYERIVAAAQEMFAADGVGASLEEIARRAGVGSATLHRHFPSRRSLLEVVFHDRVEALCSRAREHAAHSSPGDALLAWLRDLNTYAAASRGLAASLLHDGRDADLLHHNESCRAAITAAAAELLHRAQQAGTVRPDVRAEDLLALVNAISLVTEQHDDDAQANRLLDIAIDGIRPSR
ncbi:MULTISPECIES: TetR/AcrR family transcriptional regulator [Streptomyces]|uniref:TetR/AcrR family transcriptional regulator n=2 Tax=Streptomyces rimosus subsp. rimosus TaxID=132474 RepID=L8ESR9_STRR1|nr:MULTISPECIES: TetR/AcrR family transcriptional regulator [Streptomyces]KOG80050.1 TetR family transcriptional regulator [Kitasatospora aureofaciens]MYT44213.1 TetR family transcriptional regulator [Streptomyces sp. SID5471]KEF08319.1 TetR family transcriptional regulator [Streptomyces rimosus]KEF20609.1 TetR family transcriptional regulator [Streptomyces rimosus]KUJ25736.1 TetR family transcriptional regulator [Streptomyces rimosus subsp. rimosus]